MSAEDAITKKIGPLPAWAWAGSVVVLVLLFRHWQQSQADTAMPEDPTQTDLTDAANDPGQTGDPFAGGGFTGDTGTGALPASDTTDALGSVLDAISTQSDTLSEIGDTLSGISDNLNAPETPSAPKPHHDNKAQWGMHAVEDVAGHGHSPVEVETAMWKYLHHKPLSPEERKIVNQAIRKNGPPPGGVIPIKLPAKKTAAKKPAKKTAKKKPPHRKAS